MNPLDLLVKKTSGERRDRIPTPHSADSKLFKGWKRRYIVLLALLTIFNIIQACSLVRRVNNGSTDFTVFYNTGVLLREGAGPDIYAGKDQSTEWLRTIPPFGQWLLHPLTALSARGAAAVWSALNLAMLGLGLVWLSRAFERLDAKRRLMSRVTPIICLVMFALAPGSIQVGQYSVLFVACWILYLRLLCGRYSKFAEAALAIPAAVKLYPALMIAPAVIRRKWLRCVCFTGWIVVAAVLPTVTYGERTFELTQSFWNNAIFSSSGRIAESQQAQSVNDQGIDSIALRYLTDGQPIQRQFPMLPHAALQTDTVLKLVNITRLAILLISAVVGMRYLRRRRRRRPLWDTVVLMSLFSAALYLILPGAKSRYAIYELFAFIPLVCRAFVCGRMGKKTQERIWLTTAAVLLLLVATFLPAAPRAFGLGFCGIAGLWTINIILIYQWSRSNDIFTRKAAADMGSQASSPAAGVCTFCPNREAHQNPG